MLQESGHPHDHHPDVVRKALLAYNPDSFKLALPAVSARAFLPGPKVSDSDSALEPNVPSKATEWTLVELHFLDYIFRKVGLSVEQKRLFMEYFTQTTSCEHLRRLCDTQFGPRLLGVLDDPKSREFVFENLLENFQIEVRLREWIERFH